MATFDCNWQKGRKTRRVCVCWVFAVDVECIIIHTKPILLSLSLSLPATLPSTLPLPLSLPLRGSDPISVPLRRSVLPVDCDLISQLSSLASTVHSNISTRPGSLMGLWSSPTGQTEQ